MPESKVFNMDCMEGMKQYPDKYFDLAIVDPPYFSGPEKRKYYGQEISGHGVRRIDYTPLDETWQIPSHEYFEELYRISKHQIIWGCNYYPEVYPGSGRIFWDKVNDQSDFSDGEIAFCSKISSVRIFRYMWNGMMQGRGDGTSKQMQGNKSLNEKKIHPTQKPISLYRWLYKNYAKPGDKILDTHLGSGSSRIAAFEFGVDFTAYEKHLTYFEAQEKRFNQYKSQLKLFPA